MKSRRDYCNLIKLPFILDNVRCSIRIIICNNIMCGFVGIFNRSGLHHNDFDSMNRMLDAIYHRGPDDYGIWKDNDSGVILGHRRLSIIDLSPLGRQPMSSESGRWVIAFNGEIYNYRELKSILSEEGCNINWKGGSDTEVLLALIEAYGFKSALEKCVGMFAIAAWDRKERQLFLARDRLGGEAFILWKNWKFIGIWL